MSRVTQSWKIIVLGLSLFACSQRPVFTVEVFKSPTPSPRPVASAVPTITLTAPAILMSISSPTTPGMPSDFSPILYGKKYDANTFFLLLGGIQGELWLSPDLAAAQFVHIPSSGYDVFTLAQTKYQVDGYAPFFSHPSQDYTVRTDVTLDEPGMVAVARNWPTLQRPVHELAPDHEIYRQAVLDWLTAEGVMAPQLGSLRVFRVDIEGDGVDEIFISATHLDESQHTTKSGDYSIILMRKVTGNDTITQTIVGDIYRSQGLEITYPRTYTPAKFIDLNRDGRLEVVVDIQRWEGMGALVYQIDGQSVIESLRVE